jgi:hypothetical protein
MKRFRDFAGLTAIFLCGAMLVLPASAAGAAGGATGAAAATGSGPVGAGAMSPGMVSGNVGTNSANSIGRTSTIGAAPMGATGAGGRSATGLSASEQAVLSNGLGTQTPAEQMSSNAHANANSALVQGRPTYIAPSSAPGSNANVGSVAPIGASSTVPASGSGPIVNGPVANNPGTAAETARPVTQ